MSSDPSARRERLLAVAARRLRDGTSPYWTMTAFLFLSGVVGFVASFALLHAGVERMPVRYPLAVAAGYLAFLGLLWGWLSYQRGETGDPVGTGLNTLANLAQVTEDVTASVPSGGGKGGSSLSGIDVGDADGCGAVVVAILVTVAVVAVLAAAVYAVAIAPTLMAELLVDGLVVGSLPRRRTRHWTRTALTRTGWAAGGLAVLLGLVGWGLETVVPGAHTMGQAMGFGQAK